MPTLLFATHNTWKGEQFLPTFAAYGIQMLTLQDCPIRFAKIEENGCTPEDNTLRKARQVHSLEYPWVFGDDAGLEIEALDGEPGLQARRWGGKFTDEIDDETWLDYLLERMRHVPAGQRRACFHSGWALIAPDGSAHIHTLTWPFEIAVQRIRPLNPGSPISAVRTGPADDLERRRGEIRQEWERWGILAELCTKFGV